MLDLPRAMMASSKLIREFRPDVMIGVGGYASGPTMLMGGHSAPPDDCVRAECRSRVCQSPGRANRESGGSPVRANLPLLPQLPGHGSSRTARVLQRASTAERRDHLRLLVFGGSQGAHAINQAVLDALPRLSAAIPGLCIIHQTGEKDYVDAQAVYLKHMVAAEVSPFIDDMPGAFARADLVLCRSGASTVAEITAAGKPAIFVPLPTAADDHQRHNAEILTSGNAARLLPQSELSGERLVAEIGSLLSDRALLAKMSEAARGFAHPDAAATIAAMAARYAGIQSQHAIA